MDKKQGLIAILGALGAANYSETGISKFLDSRSRVLHLLNQKTGIWEARGSIREGSVTFHF